METAEKNPSPSPSAQSILKKQNPEEKNEILSNSNSNVNTLNNIPTTKNNMSNNIEFNKLQGFDVLEKLPPKNFNYTYNQDGLGAGYNYEYRIVAQDYTTEDPEKATHITYFTHHIGATTRNKTLTIEFKTSDTNTMNLYNEILDKYGNLSIQVKNMNIDQIKMQQTKFYVGNESLESNYYNISQGDYAILVNLPEGYAARVKIVGGSSEGYLQDNPYVQGKRLRLPFANSQTIRLEVTLQRREIQTTWGIVRYKSLCREYNTNYV